MGINENSRIAPTLIGLIPKAVVENRIDRAIRGMDTRAGARDQLLPVTARVEGFEQTTRTGKVPMRWTDEVNIADPTSR